ncbi:hypothetical protein ACOBQX_15880 [Actinokineospora sp. G85]|uniref:hypothetical protein n=1 Tax=Actinokineospora sp. G85 TaxID=3406626 RepID=UPI003C768E15
MVVAQHVAVAEVTRRLSGRLSDDAVGAVAAQFAAGEVELASSALLLGLVAEQVAVTAAEAVLIRGIVDDPNDPVFAEVPHADLAPPPAHRFSPTGPPEAPDPAGADHVLAAEAALVGARRVRRAWREPLPDAPHPPAWVYLVQVAPEVDELRATAALRAKLWVRRQEKWPIEVVADGGLLPPYHAAAVTAARQIWSS